MGRQAKKECLNEPCTHYKQKIKGDVNCDIIDINPHGIAKRCFHFDQEGKESGHSEGRGTGEFNMEKLKISPQLEPFVRKEGENVHIELPKGKFMRMDSVEYTQGWNWNSSLPPLGGFEPSKSEKAIQMNREAEPTEVSIRAQKAPILGSVLEREESAREKRKKRSE